MTTTLQLRCFLPPAQERMRGNAENTYGNPSPGCSCPGHAAGRGPSHSLAGGTQRGVPRVASDIPAGPGEGLREEPAPVRVPGRHERGRARLGTAEDGTGTDI